MNIRSKLLDLDIELMETEDGLFILPHATIDKILMENPRIKVELTAKQLRPDMCVVEAIAFDEETGRRTPIKIGESNPKNLENDISKKFPATLAYQRATDRAVILLLDLPMDKKIYSSIEIDNLKYKKNNNNTKNDAIATTIMEPISSDEIALVTAPELPFPNSISQTTETVSEKPPVTKTSYDGIIPDDEIMLVGGSPCLGKKYGDVKNLPEFKAFLKWLKTSTASYPDANKQAQYEKFKNFVMRGVA